MADPTATPAPAGTADRTGATDLLADPDDVAGLAVSGDGAVAVWDRRGLWRLTPGHAPELVVDAASYSPAYDPVDVHVEADGTVLIAEVSPGRLTRFRPDGTVDRHIDLPFEPRAVTTDAHGDTIVLRLADPTGLWLYRVDDDGGTEPLYEPLGG